MTKNPVYSGAVSGKHNGENAALADIQPECNRGWEWFGNN